MSRNQILVITTIWISLFLCFPAPTGSSSLMFPPKSAKSRIPTGEILIASNHTANLAIERLHLFFENRRAETTIPRGTTSTKAFAEIRYGGTGMLEGFWEVDGRLLSNVKRHIPYGNNLILVSPDVPPIPTVKTGTHKVRFVITRPSEDLPLPVAIYFVTEKRSKLKRTKVTLISPPDESRIYFKRVSFTWKGEEGPATYLVEFFDLNGETPIFSAYSKTPLYRVPPAVLSIYFSPGKEYSWRVKVFNAEKNRTGVSPLFRFGFKKDH